MFVLHVALLLCLICLCYATSHRYCYGPNEVFTTNHNPECEPRCDPPNRRDCAYLSGRSGCTCERGFVRHPSGTCLRLEDCPRTNPIPLPYPYPRTYPYLYPYPNPYVGRYADPYADPYPSPYVYPNYDSYGSSLGKSKPTLSSEFRNK